MFNKVQSFDQRVADRITAIHRPVINRIMIISTYLGNAALIWWLTLCVPFVISKKYRNIGIILTLSLGVTYVLGEILIKNIVGRMRPSSKLNDDEVLINRPKDHSFPSGHTASSFTAFTVTMLTCPAFIWIPVLIGACIISFSRIYLRVHYVSDVLAGVVLGMTSGWCCVMLLSKVFPIN